MGLKGDYKIICGCLALKRVHDKKVVDIIIDTPENLRTHAKQAGLKKGTFLLKTLPLNRLSVTQRIKKERYLIRVIGQLYAD